MSERAIPQIHGRLLARNTLLNLAGFGAPLVVAFVALPALIHHLGTAAFGVLAIAWVVQRYLTDLGLGATTTKFAAEELGAGRVSRLPAIAWTTALMQVALGFLEGVALAMATPWLVHGVLKVPADLQTPAGACLYLLALALPVISATTAFQGLLEAAQRFDLVTLVKVPATVAAYALPVVGAVLGWPLPAVFGLVLLPKVIALFAYFWIALRLHGDLDWRPRLDSDWRSLLGFGGWVTVSSVVSPLLVYVDRLLVGALLSMTAVAYYAPPMEVTSRISLLPLSLVATLFPAFSQLSGAADRARAEALAVRSVKVLLVLLGPMLVLIVGGAHDLLRLWLGDEFARQSGLALQVLAVGVLFNAAAHVPYALLHGAGRPDVPARFHLLELPLHLGLAWFLVSHWGITGAAIAWSTRLVLDAVLLFGATARLGLLGNRALLEPRLVGLGVLILGAGWVAAATAGVVGLGPRVAAVLVIAAGVAALGWLGGMSALERKRILMLVRPVYDA